MTFRRYRYLIYADLYRYGGHATILTGLRHLGGNPGYQYTFWMRTKAFFSNTRPAILAKPLWVVAAAILRRYTFKYGISIPAEASIGPGLHIGHFGGIVVNTQAVIGRNCNLSHGVTLGQANRGRNAGAPIVGDNVYIGPGAKLVGAVHVGNNAAIGANAVVTRNVCDCGVSVGIPNVVISDAGSGEYVVFTDYLSEAEWGL